MIQRHILPAIVIAATASVAVAATPEIRQGDALATFVWHLEDDTFFPESLLPVFHAEEISDATFARMKGKSFPADCSVRRAELRYLLLPHYDGQGCVRIGEMVCNAAIADELVEIFRQLYQQAYPIERMVLIDDYDGDDELSMKANNTSCFNFRRVAGSKKLSRHAYGMAVDINPLYNPYVRTLNGWRVVTPEGAARYADRSLDDIPYKITLKDPAYKLFRKYGYSWGGSWRTRKDYQHFQK